MSSFDDVLAANREYAPPSLDEGGPGQAAKGLAVLTCMDSRIEPLATLGLQRGDAKIMRNAGARVTDDVLRTLVLANALLNVERVLVMAHTDCAMAGTHGGAGAGAAARAHRRRRPQPPLRRHARPAGRARARRAAHPQLAVPAGRHPRGRARSTTCATGALEIVVPEA